MNSYDIKKFMLFTNSMFILFLILWTCIICVVNASFNSADKMVYKEIRPLFNSSFYNPVFDSKDGNLLNLAQIINQNSYSFAYLYAHWNLPSRNKREIIQKLESELNQTVKFTAINCFSSSNECFKHFNLYFYPQFLIYVRNSGFHTYRGPNEYISILNYIESMQSPLKRVDNLDEFLDFVIINDGALITYMNLSYKSKELYNSYYYSSLKSLNYDVENPIIFTITLNETLWKELIKTTNLDTKKNQILAFSCYNYEGAFTNITNFTHDSLVQWGYSTIRRTIQWRYPDKLENSNVNINSYNKTNLMIFMKRDFKNLNSIFYLIKKMFIIETYETFLDQKETEEINYSFGEKIVDRLNDGNKEICFCLKYFIFTSEICIPINATDISTQLMMAVDLLKDIGYFNSKKKFHYSN